ncbi:calpain-A [Drosophila navojoa]|uniref:calpain-A n=1 Tax=Drosophila navojoa TaxID=7232 RepID=UPI0011BFC08F|nr:calpain-A [Drosophila navojoa]
MDELKGFFKQAGQEFLNAAGQAAMGAAKEVVGSVINEIFVKKESETKRILPSIKNMRVLGETQSNLGPYSEVQDYETILNSCLTSGSLFEDPQFPASNESLMFSRRPDRYIEWLRPHEIVENPQFFVEGYSRFDVQQGELGDCWLLAATANLTSESSLFFRVIPPEQSFQENYAGIFHFRFWQYGKWVDVIIDDRLPTYRGELLYMHSAEKNEFWSALLEKAYAKLHGSYEALKGGTTCEAMEDFTGGVSEWFDLKEAPPNLFTILQKAAERNSMMGCSIEADPNVLEAETPQGLIRGHAYSITKVCLIDIVTPNRQGKIPMIRMRNPWGNEAEWNGPWSDSSPEWRYIPEEQKQEIGLNFDRDGEFWMTFQDFLTHFDRVELCNLSPESFSKTSDDPHSGKRKWEMSMYEGEWTPGVTAGGCRNFLDTFWHNPQYIITLVDPDEQDEEGNCTVIVALMQKNRRSKRNMGMECLTIGFAINNFKNHSSSILINHVNFSLPYRENDDHVGYGDDSNKVIPGFPTPKPVDPQKEGLRRLFDSIAGKDMEVDWMELKRILDHSMRDDLPKAVVYNRQTTYNAFETQAGTQDEIPGNACGLLSLICGPFLKGTPFEEQLGGNDQSNKRLIEESPAAIVDETHGFSKDVCRSMVAMLDADKSGKLGFEEFEALLSDIAKWKAIFKTYDTENSGRISGFQLREALNSAGYHLNNRVLNALGHRYGSRDGKIAFDDFLMCAVKIKTYIEIFRERDTEKNETATFTLEEWIEQTIYS